LAKEEATKKHSNSFRKLENPTTIYKLWWISGQTGHYINSYFDKKRAEKDKETLEKIFRFGRLEIQTYPKANYF
jgi:hypothetical protein